MRRTNKSYSIGAGALTAIALSLLSLTGCGAAGDTQGASAPAQEETVEEPKTEEQAETQDESATDLQEQTDEVAETEAEESSDKESSAESETFRKIKENGFITFATEGTYAPYSFHDDNNELVGFDVEVAQAIAGKIGVEAKFTETQWDGIIAGLDANKYDAISNQVSITPERQEKYLFSDPYTYVYGVVIVGEDNDEIGSFEDLDGKDVSLTVTSNWAQVAESYGGKIVSTSGFNESIQLVLQGRADATVNDNVTFYDFIANQPDAKAKIVATSDEATESAILIRKGDDDLQAAVNEALAQLREEGKLKEISEKYFGTDITVPN
ncbi:MAG: amino acid ABC transporter substrate-binding protein [Lachnospiraceae bacterium]|nr:amino acid ABC transporter substrate-binding protein [Lachnospiraceae bacterium]